MARRLRDEEGKIVRIEFSATEFAKILEVEPDDLAQWTTCLPPDRGHGPDAVYGVAAASELQRLRRRAALLNTRMSEKAVANVEKEGLLMPYAALAEDCPPGVTAHVWRSYGLVVLMQSRYGKKIDASELAERAHLVYQDPQTGETKFDVEKADMHIRLLVALNHLNDAGNRWEHNGLPEAWRGV